MIKITPWILCVLTTIWGLIGWWRFTRLRIHYRLLYAAYNKMVTDYRRVLVSSNRQSSFDFRTILVLAFLGLAACIAGIIGIDKAEKK